MAELVEELEDLCGVRVWLLAQAECDCLPDEAAQLGRGARGGREGEGIAAGSDERGRPRVGERSAERVRCE